MAPVPLDPRKQPRQKRAQATVAIIVEGAARILEERGIEGFNTNAVAERAGVSIGTLYQYFPNKQALVAALIGATQDRLIGAVEKALAATAGRPLAERVEALVWAAMSIHLANRGLATALDHEEERLPVDAVMAPRLLRGESLLAEWLDEHAAECPGIDGAAAPTVIRTMVRAIVDAFCNAGRHEPELAHRETSRAVLAYLTFSAGPRAAPSRRSPAAEAAPGSASSSRR